MELYHLRAVRRMQIVSNVIHKFESMAVTDAGQSMAIKYTQEIEDECFPSFMWTRTGMRLN